MRGVTCAVSTIMQISKIFLLISFAMFCPRIFIFYSSRFYAYQGYHETSFKLGLENINESTKELFLTLNKKPRIALITNQAGEDQKGKRAVDILCKKNMHIKKIIAPALGKSGAQSALKIDALKDTVMGIPIYSLYSVFGQLKTALFNDVDMLVFDVPDISLSYAMYIQTLSDVLILASKQKKAVIVLDRPNLSGAKMEGAVELAEEIFHLPVRLGMPNETGGLQDIVRNPIHATGVGLLHYGLKQQFSPLPGGKNPTVTVNDGALTKMKRWIQNNF